MPPVGVQVFVPTRGTPQFSMIEALDVQLRLNGMMAPQFVLAKRGVAEGRAVIVNRFLASDAEILVMVDDDVLVGSMEFIQPLIDGDLDICASPVPVVRSDYEVICPNVYYAEGPKWVPDFELMFGAAESRRLPCGAIEVEAVGTGCIAIHRRVLESLKEPFRPEIVNGVWKTGEDIQFCKRAKQKGFSIGVWDASWCDHIVPVHLNTIARGYLNRIMELQERLEAHAREDETDLRGAE